MNTFNSTIKWFFPSILFAAIFTNFCAGIKGSTLLEAVLVFTSIFLFTSGFRAFFTFPSVESDKSEMIVFFKENLMHSPVPVVFSLLSFSPLIYGFMELNTGEFANENAKVIPIVLFVFSALSLFLNTYWPLYANAIMKEAEIENA